MNTHLSWGIIGTGNIAHTLAHAVQESRTGVLTAVGSRSEESARGFGAEFGIEAAHCHARYEALLSDPSVDAVYISTPHPLHAEWAIKAAEAGKHILCEKPLTLNYTDSLPVVEAARRNNVFLMEAFMYRCHPQTARIVEIVRSGEIGAVRLIEAQYSYWSDEDASHRLWRRDLGGGGILDVGCYPVSFARLIAAVALGKESVEPLEVKGAGRLHPEIGIDEYSSALLSFEGDIIAQVSTGIALERERDGAIYGTRGRIHIANPWLCPGGLLIALNNGEQREESIAAAESLYALEVDAFAAGVATGRAPFPAMTPEDTLANMATLDRWRREIGVVYDSEK